MINSPAGDSRRASSRKVFAGSAKCSTTMLQARSPQYHFPREWCVHLVLSASVTGLHCAEATFHLPELFTNTTVVASCELSLADLVVRMPVRMAVSPNRRTDTALQKHRN